jgi:hypothetical protein
LSGKTRADDEGIRLFDEQFAFGAGSPCSVIPHKLSSDEMLFG